MVGRIGGLAGAVFIAAVVLSACGDDDAEPSADTDQDDVTTTSPAPPDDADDADDNHVWSSGSATFELGGERWEFALEMCATQPLDPGTDTHTLRVDGTAVDDPGTTLQVVETVTDDGLFEIQVASVYFKDPDGNRLHAWEAQRVVDTESGEVDDMHGDGTVPLLEVDEGDDLVVSVTDAAFWQFDMTRGGDDRVVGTGNLDATCTRD